VLDYFLTTQQVATGQRGHFHRRRMFPSAHSIGCCETGSILGIFAQHAICGRVGRAFGATRRPCLKAAVGFKAAGSHQADGCRRRKGLALRLMPPVDHRLAGIEIRLLHRRVHLAGLDRLASAYELARCPKAAWLRPEADDYRGCILEAMHRSLKPHPFDPALKWVPSDVYEDPAKSPGNYYLRGPRALSAPECLSPDDPIVPMIEGSLRRAGCMSDLFGFRMRNHGKTQPEETPEQSAGGKVDLYYVNMSEANLAPHVAGARRNASKSPPVLLHDARLLHVARRARDPRALLPAAPWLLPVAGPTPAATAGFCR